MIPEDKIKEIQNATDILEIVSDSVVLKKAGKNYQGLCPFHAEKTPSFSVNPIKQIFYCFGCGVGGNIFSFLMKKDGMSFPEAVKFLAKRTGIDLPDRPVSPEQKQRMTEREQILAVNRLAKDFYRGRLKAPGGQRASAYLVKRGLPAETVDKFQLGYAPDGWEHLASFLRSKRVPSVLAEKTGLIVPRKNGSGHYDAFRNRIVFPIFNASRQVIGFGGRVMDDSLPKYLNSPETPVFNKRRSLYGIDQARPAARETGVAYVVEGYLDLIAMCRHGFTNAVATLGTALTGEHVRLLRGLVGGEGRVVLVFDSDAAGIKAAERSIEVFAKEYVDAYILVLGEGHDPDSFLSEYGAKRFAKSAGNAVSTVTFLIESAVRRHGLSPEGKIRILADLQPSLSAIGDPVARSLYVKSLSERIDVDEGPVMEKISQGAQARGPGLPGARTATAPSNAVPGIGMPTGAPRIGVRDRMESRIVAMMLQMPSMIEKVRRQRLVDYFETPILKQICRALLENCAGFRENPGALLDIIEPEEARALAASLAIGEEQWDEAGCQKLISQFEASRRRGDRSLLRDIKAAEAANDEETLFRLLKEKQELARKKSRPLRQRRKL